MSGAPVPVQTPTAERTALPPLVRDPTCWFVLALVAFASGYTAWLVLGREVPFGVDGPFGVSAVPGALTTGVFAIHVRRGRALGELDRAASWLIVVACGLFWLSTVTMRTNGADLLP
jgi:hypothetical protein